MSLFCSLTVPLDSLRVILRYTFSVIITDCKVVLCAGISLLCRFLKPHDRFSIILFHSFAFVITDAKVVLCFGISLLSSFSKPLDRFGAILFHTFAFVIADAKVELCLLVSLFRSRAEFGGGQSGKIPLPGIGTGRPGAGDENRAQHGGKNSQEDFLQSVSPLGSAFSEQSRNIR